MTHPNSIRYDTGPTLTVHVADYTCSWNGGIFAGDPELVNWANTLADTPTTVTAFDTTGTTGRDTPLAALLAIASYWPGRAIITQLPNELQQQLPHLTPNHH